MLGAGQVSTQPNRQTHWKCACEAWPVLQVIDTVFLFHFKRQRKLSLRFLASYLLQEDIQQNTHDSVEDARTAVNLYQVLSSMDALLCRSVHCPFEEDGFVAFCEHAQCLHL